MTAGAAPWDYPLDRTQVDVTEELVRHLLGAQFPSLAALALGPAGPWGTDNAMFRLGDELVVRVPRSGWAKDSVAKEVRWLPSIAAQLPIPVPEVVGCGAPTGDYPWTWAVYRWLPGGRPPLSDPAPVEELAPMLRALAATTPDPDAPTPGPHNGFRGGPAAARDRWVRPAILRDTHPFDRDALLAFWDDACSLPVPPPGEWVWVHGDLTPNNLLVDGPRLSALLDWGCLAVGDHAVDLMVAWHLDRPARDRLREQLAVDDATWARGRAAAFWQWVAGATTDPDNEANRVIERVLADAAEEA